ncbi:uncharacterized protein [Oscarella lobularis]|uniref:uncharacterized protein n=1 Tax=Oscarella lobularis TaxID=121494 RepID=UPI00331411D3
MQREETIVENCADFLTYARLGLEADQKLRDGVRHCGAMTEKEVINELVGPVEIATIASIRARLAGSAPSLDDVTAIAAPALETGRSSRDGTPKLVVDLTGAPLEGAENNETATSSPLNEMVFKSRLDMLSTVSIADAMCNGINKAMSSTEGTPLRVPSPMESVTSSKSSQTLLSSPEYIPVLNGVWVTGNAATLGLPAAINNIPDEKREPSSTGEEDDRSDGGGGGGGGTQYQCELCGDILGSTNQLGQHMRVHSADKPFTCHYCMKTFTQRSHLTRHLYTHTGEKPYKCPHCEKSFARSTTLADHVNTHTHSRPHKCPYCERAFNQKSGLRYHIRTHTGERPFHCSYCQKSFISSSQLTKHTCRITSDSQ